MEHLDLLTHSLLHIILFLYLISATGLTHVSRRLLQILIVHIRWDETCGILAWGEGIRQLTPELRLDVLELPAVTQKRN